MTDEPWGDVPPIPADTDVRSRIRRLRAESGRMIGVLDDDPTGSQSVHGIQVVTVPDPAEYRAALTGSTPTAFVLTNTRSMAEPAAVALNMSVGADLVALAEKRGQPIDIVSRSDSTLRGHFFAEIAALERVRAARGRSHDAVLFVPAYLEAGRVTAGDIHWARVDGRYVPVGQTEFARDATFGYSESNLREFVMSSARGAIGSERVHSISLGDIRIGGPERVAEILDGAGRGDVVVVNALDYTDLEAVALAALAVEAGGKSFLYRTGPSFVRALDGQEPRAPLAASEIWPHGHPGRHGLIVVGSHVGQTSRQVAVLGKVHETAEVELDVPALLARAERTTQLYVDEMAGRIAAALERSDVLLLTSRTLVAASDRESSLLIAQRVSACVSAIVNAVLSAEPAWVLAKGGITSHDVAVTGLGIRRAEVAGQLFAGMVSVYRPISADARAVGRPYVVFAGNVGDENALADVAARMSGEDGV
jgi:uncharacterized protein YgbK (DUF1537 family)